MSAVFFVLGVPYDTLTLTRIDRLQDNLILLFYLVALGFLVVLTGRHCVATVAPAAQALLSECHAVSPGQIALAFAQSAKGHTLRAVTRTAEVDAAQ